MLVFLWQVWALQLAWKFGAVGLRKLRVPHFTRGMEINQQIIYDISRGHSKGMFVVKSCGGGGGGRGGSSKSEQKRTGEGKSRMSVRLLCERNCLIFQTTNIVLSDKLLGSCWKFCCFEPSAVYKDVFLLQRRRHFFFFISKLVNILLSLYL